MEVQYIAIAVALALSACKRTPPPDPPSPNVASATVPVALSQGAPSASSPEPASSESTIVSPEVQPHSIEEKPRAAVSHKDFARSTLYFWASAEQVAMLRRDRSLIDTLRKAKLPLLGTVLKAAKDPTSLQLLRVLNDNDQTFCGRVWSNPWGLFELPGNKSKARTLVKLTLRSDSYIGFFDARQRRPWRFVDLKGHDVAAGKVMAKPARIGAIYYLIDGETPQRGYALSSEEAIASWSLETNEIRTSLSEASATLLSWKQPESTELPWPRYVADTIWPEKLDAPEASLASTIVAYQPDRWSTIAGAIKPSSEKSKEKPLVVKPSSARGAFGDLTARGVQKQFCTEHGDKTRCAPLPPSNRRAFNGRFCMDEEGHMRDCKKR